MSHKSSPKRRGLSHAMPLVFLSIVSVVSSFALGIRTAGDVETVAPLQAEDMRMAGDINGDHTVDVRDVLIVLEIAQGYSEAAPEELLADPNGDGQLTVDDAMRMLRDIASR